MGIESFAFIIGAMGKRLRFGVCRVSVKAMRQSLRTRLTAYVFVKLKTFARCGCALLCVASVFLHAVDLEGLSLPTAETLRAATDKLERDLKTLVTLEERSAARGEVAMLFHAQFLLDAAEIEYTRAIEEVSLAQWHYLRGIVRMDQGRVLDAIGDFSEVVRQEPKDHLALYRLGTALAVTGNHQGAKAVLLRAELQAPESPAVLAALADTSIAAKNWVLAKEYLERSWAAESSGQVAYKLGLVWRRLGNLRASEEWIQRRSSAAPTIDDPVLLEVADRSISPSFFVRAAKWAWERGDVDEALQAYRFASNLAPNDVGIGLGFAGMLEGLGQVGEAIEEVRRLVRENPDEGSAWRRLAMLLHPTDVIAALDAARTAQGIDNDDISGALLAAVAMKARSYALAVSTYEELTARNGDNPYYFYWLAMARLADRHCSLALESLAEAIRIRPSWGEAHVVQIRALALCGDLAVREQARDKAVALLRQRSDTDMRLTLAFAEMSLGNLGGAEKLIELERLHPDAAMLADALGRKRLPTLPFAAESPWWQPEEIRYSLAENTARKERKK